MADRPDAYVRKDPGDIIRSGDWNELQTRAREEIRAHKHTGKEDGTQIPRTGIEAHAIDGSLIDPAADVTVNSLTTSTNLTVKGNLTINGKAILGDIQDLLAKVKGLESDKVNRLGDTITGNLDIKGSLNIGKSLLSPNGTIGIGIATSPIAKLDISQGARTGTTHPASIKGLYVTGDFGEAEGVEFRHSNGSQGIGLGYNTLYATGSNADQDLQLKPKGNGTLRILGNVSLGGFTAADADEWPKVTWFRDIANNWDEGLIKHDHNKGFFGRSGFGIHLHSTRDWTFFSTGWDALLGIEGGTGNVKIKGNLSSNKLSFGAWPAGGNYGFIGTNALDQAIGGNYALLQSGAGGDIGYTYVNSPVSLRLRINNGDKMVIDANTVSVSTVLSVPSGIRVDGDRSTHIDTDGAFYRFGGQSYITIDDNLFIRDFGRGNIFWINSINKTAAWSSDSRLKTDITPMTGMLEKVSALQGVFFKWKDGKSDDRQLGLLAQEVGEVFPELVSTDPDGMKGVNYIGFIAVLIEALKEQQTQIQQLFAAAK